MSMIRIDWSPPRRTLRSFGIICLVGFPLLALMACFRVMAFAALPESAVTSTATVLATIGVLSGLLALIAPIALRPLYLGLSIIALPIGLVVSNTLLILLYYLVLTPIALVFKLIGRDSMHRTLNRSASTYWIERKPPADTKRYFRQF